MDSVLWLLANYETNELNTLLYPVSLSVPAGGSQNSTNKHRNMHKYLQGQPTSF